jgi:hypothetical protein
MVKRKESKRNIVHALWLSEAEKLLLNCSVERKELINVK